MTEDKKERREFLVQKRKQIKSNSTRLENLLKSYDNTPLARLKLLERRKALSEQMQELSNITAELTIIEVNVKHEEEDAKIRDSYEDLSAKVDIATTPVIPVNQVIVQENPGNNQPIITHSQPSAHNHTKIPKIGLKTFDGSLEKWKPFHDWFKSNIDDQARGLGDGVKLSYLQACLTGEAEKTIEGFEATNENYKEAWELLLATYDQKPLIINRHYELLLAIPKLTNATSESIRQLVNESQVHVRGMKVLGEPVEQWNTPLVHLILSKLDNNTRKE